MLVLHVPSKFRGPPVKANKLYLKQLFGRTFIFCTVFSSTLTDKEQSVNDNPRFKNT